MRKSQSILCFLVLFFATWLSTQAEARPEYAARHRITRCTACHVSPVGGGVRNLNGKNYGARGLKIHQLSNQEMLSLDLRGIYYSPGKTTTQKGGMGVMAGNVAANLPITEFSEEQVGTRVVFTQNIGGFPGGAGSPRSTFLRWKFYRDTEQSWAPQYVLVGRFPAPFGVITDEHRTYTDIQTRNTWIDLEMGALLSGDPFESLHYDWAIVNGEKTAGTGFGTGRSTLWGSILNLRWTPQNLPFIFGMSGSYHDRIQPEKPGAAGSIYSILSFGRMTGERIPSTLTLEYVTARHWNPAVTNFVSDPAYLDSVAASTSRGYLAKWVYPVHRRFDLIYKFDYLELDKDFPADHYVRHGFGTRMTIGPNMLLQVRLEEGRASHPSEEGGSGRGVMDAGWVLLQVSL